MYDIFSFFQTTSTDISSQQDDVTDDLGASYYLH